MAKVKICGLTKAEDYHACQNAGAAFVGLVFHTPSPRHLTDDMASVIAAMRQADGPKLVALCVNASDETLTQINEVCAPDWIQLHGSETPERCEDVQQKFGLPILKAISISSDDDIALSSAYYDHVDMLLFDAATGNPEMPGGSGHSFDWSLLSAAGIRIPWMLAGGLTPQNVAMAIEQTSASFVDVSSGVESARGIKDHDAIKRFVSAAELG